MTVAIGTAAVGEVGRLLEIRHAAFAAQAPAAYTPAEVATLLADVDEGELRAMIAAGRLFAARAGGLAVGLAGWKGRRVRHVYVHPDHVRQGIASRLLRHVESDYRDRTGEPVLLAGVALHARDFYVANGYEILGRATAWDGSAYLEAVKAL